MYNDPYIDNELLISLVEQRPVLWDKTTELYKNRVATVTAWKEIMITLDPNYETKDEKAKQEFTKLVIQRWTRIRDSYHRSCKKIQDQMRSGSDGKITKPYVYSKQLRFLQNVIETRPSICNVTVKSNNTDSDPDEASETDSVHEIATVNIPNCIPKRSISNSVSPVKPKLIKYMDSYSINETNRHLLFFNGILPSLDKLDEDEVLEFQMGVLQLLKKIKNSRQTQLKTERLDEF